MTKTAEEKVIAMFENFTIEEKIIAGVEAIIKYNLVVNKQKTSATERDEMYQEARKTFTSKGRRE